MDIGTLASSIGRQRIADALGVGYSAVTEAVRSGQFPAAWYPVVTALGADAGLVVPMCAFRWKAASGCSNADASAPVNQDNNPVTGLQPGVGG